MASDNRTIYEISESFFHHPTEDGTPEDPKNPIRIAQTSWKLVDWVIKHSALEGRDKLVAATIASYYSKKNRYAHPTLTHICAQTGLSRRTAERAIEAMKLSGEWAVVTLVNRNDANMRTSNRYYPLAPLPRDKTKSYKEFLEEWAKTTNINYSDTIVTTWESTYPAEWLKQSATHQGTYKACVEQVKKKHHNLTTEKAEKLLVQLLMEEYRNMSLPEQKKLYTMWIKANLSRNGWNK